MKGWPKRTGLETFSFCMSRSPVCSGLMCEPRCINTNERVKRTEVLLKARRLGKKAAVICMQRWLYGVAKQKGPTRSKWEAADLSVLGKWCIIARTRFASASCGGLSISLSTHWKKREELRQATSFLFLTRGPWWHRGFLVGLFVCDRRVDTLQAEVNQVKTVFWVWRNP